MFFSKNPQKKYKVKHLDFCCGCAKNAPQFRIKINPIVIKGTNPQLFLVESMANKRHVTYFFSALLVEISDVCERDCRNPINLCSRQTVLGFGAYFGTESMPISMSNPVNIL